jgi:hypothetical protein
MQAVSPAQRWLPTASPGLEFIVVVGHPNVPEDDPLVIRGS